MGKDKGFRKLGDLVSALADAERGLAAGTMGQEGLETACSDARELYERLVVLRHKAREAALAGAVAQASDKPKEETAPPVKPPPPTTVTVAEPGGIRLDTRPPDTPPRQTSLIEAIEATEQEPHTGGEGTPRSAADPPAPGDVKRDTKSKTSPTLAEKLEKSSIADLGKAISLSHKFWFVAELFNGDRIGYEKTIIMLNGLPGKEAALALLDDEVLPKLKKPADPEALAAFRELLERRFA